MKICVIAHTLFGDDYRVQREAKYLADLNIEIDLHLLRYDVEAKREIMPHLHIYRILRYRKPKSAFMYSLQLGLFFLASFFWVSFRHFRKRYDIIHIHTIPDFLVFSASLAKLFGARIVLDMHENMPALYMRKYNRSEQSLVIRLLKWMELSSANYADRVIAASPFIAKELARQIKGKNKIHTILNLPELEYFPDHKRVFRGNGVFNLIYPGTLSELHGVDVAIRAMNHIAQETTYPIKLHIYGIGPEKENLEKLVDDLELRDSVEINHVVPFPQLAEILRNMDLGIVPKRGGLFAEEAMSTKLFEFAAAGLPIAASRTTGDSLYFDNSTVWFFTPGDSRELADGILMLYKNPVMRQNYSNNLKNLAKSHSWNQSKGEFYAIFNELYEQKNKVCSHNTGKK